MDKQERYARESDAKGGSVPPDERRNSKARSASSKAAMPNEGSSFDKREESKLMHEQAGEITTVDIERLPAAARKAIRDRDLES